ncbi:hypothetical protein PMIN01_11332 [Paraphaeosphaeria minitans]|uniref:Uncharacterized protein n=1 Tax=Paraphaeosphaeria minitans TaxID=565426 RepID=A0A9P6KKG7_9PLEO|nr:hypothetical protein PMIN01_11332 [Paraphaeosphaeria minitans]
MPGPLHPTFSPVSTHRRRTIRHIHRPPETPICPLSAEASQKGARSTEKHPEMPSTGLNVVERGAPHCKPRGRARCAARSCTPASRPDLKPTRGRAQKVVEILGRGSDSGAARCTERLAQLLSPRVPALKHVTAQTCLSRNLTPSSDRRCTNAHLRRAGSSMPLDTRPSPSRAAPAPSLEAPVRSCPSPILIWRLDLGESWGT